MYSIPQMSPQWASAPWGSPNGRGFLPSIGYPMGMGRMMGMGPMGYLMMPWANVYGMGRQSGRGQPYPSPATPSIRYSPNLGMSLILSVLIAERVPRGS